MNLQFSIHFTMMQQNILFVCLFGFLRKILFAIHDADFFIMCVYMKLDLFSIYTGETFDKYGLWENVILLYIFHTIGDVKAYCYFL